MQISWQHALPRTPGGAFAALQLLLAAKAEVCRQLPQIRNIIVASDLHTLPRGLHTRFDSLLGLVGLQRCMLSPDYTEEEWNAARPAWRESLG